MVLITETECIYCAVRFGYLNIFHVKLCRHLTSVHVGFVVDKFVPGQIFLQFFGFSHVNILPLMHNTHPHLHVALARTKGRSLGPSPPPPKKKLHYFGNRGVWNTVFKGIINRSRGTWGTCHEETRTHPEISKWKSTRKVSTTCRSSGTSQNKINWLYLW